MSSSRKVIRTLVAAGLALAMTTGIALASIGTGTVTASSLRLRSEASTKSTTLAFAPRRSEVTVLEKISDSWYKVSYNGQEGYMSAEWLTVTVAEPASDTAAADQPADTADPAPANDGGSTAGQGVVTADSLNVRAGAGTSYDKVGTLKKGASVIIEEDCGNGWYRITSGSVSGYVSADYISQGAAEVTGLVTASVLNVRSGAGTSYSKVGSLRQGATVTIVDSSVSGWYKITSGSVSGYVSSQYVVLMDGSVGSSSVGAAAAALAASLVGCRYVYGASGPGSFDCSGLLYYIYKQLGYTIARGSSSQYYQSGTFVSTSSMEPGDLVFFFDPRFDGSGGTLPTTHVGIYVGSNQFIHASTTTYRVQYDTLFGGYYGPYVVAAKRIG